MIQDKAIQKVIAELMRIYSSKNSVNINKCVKAVASRWIDADGTEAEFQEFCIKFYLDTQSQKNYLFEKLQNKIEKIFGLSFELYWSNKWSLMMQTGPIEPVDTILAEMDPFTHISEDFYRSKLSHLILLNFPLLSLEEKNALTDSLSDRIVWAQCRLAELGQFRVPFHITANESSAINYSYQFLSHLIFDLQRIIFDNNKRLADAPLKVDTHWGLRDQIVLLYQDKLGLKKQKLLAHIWEKATLEEVPNAYYENLNTTWDPVTHSIFENGSKLSENKISNHHGRYKALRGLFEAKKQEDLYIPEMSNYIHRSFELTREIKEVNVRKLFTDFLTNPLLPLCADKLKSILNRDLYSFDVVFNQFGITTSDTPTSYDAIVEKKFPTLNHFHAAIPDILEKFGFDAKLAREISEKIQVVTCRSGGFSSFPKMRGGKFLLTTPTDNGKMNFTSFATAMHELGHCVEGYLSLEKIDYYLLGKVPCSAFSEAFAYLFDSRSLEILEVDEVGEKRRTSKILNLFWSSFLHCGIALVDIDCWHWMYDHPGFTEDELRVAVIKISRNIWNQYFSPIIGEKDSSILAGFNVMIANPLYLPEYALAIFIQTQIEDHLEGKVLGVEMPRMCKAGEVTPDAWMIAAVGQPISYAPLLKLAESILER
jgi:hypothetical protein